MARGSCHWVLCVVGLVLAVSCESSSDDPGAGGRRGVAGENSGGADQGNAGEGGAGPGGAGEGGTGPGGASGSGAGGSGAGGGGAIEAGTGGTQGGGGGDDAGDGGVNGCIGGTDSGGQGPVAPAASATITSCECDGPWSACTAEIEGFCVEGLSCPLTLDAIRRDVAAECASEAISGIYEECSDGTTRIMWRSHQYGFDAETGALLLATTTGDVPEELRDGTCVEGVSRIEDISITAAADEWPWNTIPDCESCDFNPDVLDPTHVCRVDSAGRIALP